jgi:hypothetical protein
MTGYIVSAEQELVGVSMSMQEVISPSVDAAAGHADSGGCC